MLLSVRGHRRSAAVQLIRSNRRGVYFRGLPRLGRTNPRASVVDRSWLANLSASLGSRDSRANLKILDREKFRLDFHLEMASRDIPTSCGSDRIPRLRAVVELQG